MGHAGRSVPGFLRGDDGGARLLATVMVLPLVDGVFVALVLAGVLETAGGVLQVGLLVFSGSAATAVVLAEMEGPRRETLPAVAAIGLGLVVLAGVEAALAPTLEGVLDLATFERFAALVVLAIAAATASSRVGEYLPGPWVIVGLGLVGSVDLSGAQFVVSVEPEPVARGVAAAAVAGGFVLGLAAVAPALRRLVDVDRFRFGSAVALGTLPLSILDVLPVNAPLAVLAVAAVLAFDPEEVARGARSTGSRLRPAGGGPTDGDDEEERAPWL